VFTTNLVWATDNPSARDIKRLLSTLRCAVNLEQVFTIPDDGSRSSSRSSKSAVERERVRSKGKRTLDFSSNLLSL
jgi:hypothetical protein